MSSKRRRTATVDRRAKRPIDKQLKVVTATALNATQDSVDLYTTTFPSTVTGLRWVLNFERDAGTNGSLATMGWAIIILPGGGTQGTLAIANTNDLYQPEQHVLAFGSGIDSQFNVGGPGLMFSGSTKSMRKLKAGDKLQFVAKGVATETFAYHGTIQFFLKS